VEEAKDLISLGLGAEVDLSSFYQFARRYSLRYMADFISRLR